MDNTDIMIKIMIREAMKSIAERRPRLVYDKAKRTIVAVYENTTAPRALNITDEDADLTCTAYHHAV